MNNIIDVNKVTTTIDTAIEELKNGLNPNKFSQDEKVELKAELEDVMKLTLKVKLQYQQERMTDLMNALDNDEAVDVEEIMLTSNAIDQALNSIKAA